MLRFFIVFLFISIALSGQDPDTLLTHILKTENDTECVNQLYRYGLDLADKNPKLAFTMAKNCERISLRTNSKKHISYANNLTGVLYTKQGHYKRALGYIEKYLEVQKELSNSLGIAIGYRNLGNIYLRLKQFRDAEDFFLKALDHYNSMNNKVEVANELLNIGVIKHLEGQFDAAMQNYQRAFETGKELNNYNIKEISLNNLAQVFLDKGDLEKALACNYDALELSELMGLDVNVTDYYLSIAEIALEQKNISLAEENLNSAIMLCNKIEYPTGRSHYYNLVSELYRQKNDHKAAYENLRRYVQLNDSLLSLRHEEPVIDLEETEKPTYNCSKTTIKNTWLLTLLSLILIIVPFVLIRYKR